MLILQIQKKKNQKKTTKKPSENPHQFLSQN